MLLVEQLCAVDLHRLDRYVGQLTPEEQRAVDEAVEIVLAM
jgi:mRNA-degrading endonuclease toxin of MazEF toxin-antitoxin module